MVVAPESGDADEIASRPAILVVDDFEPNLVAMEAVLEPLDCRVVRAASGNEALHRILSEDFSLILLDVMMPELDGFETASLIRQRKRSRKIPIIFVSALSRDAADQIKGYAHGAVDYIVKPLDPDILRAKVRSLVEFTQPTN